MEKHRTGTAGATLLFLVMLGFHMDTACKRVSCELELEQVSYRFAHSTNRLGTNFKHETYAIM